MPTNFAQTSLITLNFNALYAKTGAIASGESVQDVIALLKTIANWPNGTADDQADLVFADSKTGVGTTTTDYTLTSLTSPLGLLNFARVRLIYVANTGASPLLVAPGATNSFNTYLNPGGATTGIIVGVGGFLLLTHPKSTSAFTTASSHITFNIAAQSGTTNYDLVLIGASV